MCTKALPSCASLLRLGIAQALRVSEAPRDFTVAIELAEVLGRRHQRVVHRSPLAGLAGFQQPDVLAAGSDLLEVVDRLIVGRELVVGAGPEAEHRLGRRDTALAEQGDRNGQREQQERGVGEGSHASGIILPRLLHGDLDDPRCGFDEDWGRAPRATRSAPAALASRHSAAVRPLLNEGEPTDDVLVEHAHLPPCLFVASSNLVAERPADVFFCNPHLVAE